MTLGKTIAQLRIQKNWRQADLAERLGVHPSHVTRWEADRVRPRRRTLESLAQALEVSLEELLETDHRELGSRIVGLEDPVLTDLLGQVHKLDEREREALKTFLESMITRAQLEEVLQQRKSGPSVLIDSGRRRARRSA